MSSKIELILSNIIALDKMKYKFENEAVLEVLEKLIITATNLLVCYLIIKVYYTRLLLITKLIFLGIEFKVFRKANCTYDDIAKPGRETQPS